MRSVTKLEKLIWDEQEAFLYQQYERLRAKAVDSNQDTQVYLELSAVLYGLGRYRESLKCLRSANETRPNDLRIVKAFGFTLMSVGQFDEALRTLQLACTNHPNDLELREELERVKSEKAIYDNLVSKSRRNPHNLMFELMLAEQYVRYQQYDKALRHLIGLGKEHSTGEVLRLIAYCYYQIDFENPQVSLKLSALEACKQAVDLAHEDSDSMWFYAICLSALEIPEEEELALKRYASRVPSTFSEKEDNVVNGKRLKAAGERLSELAFELEDRMFGYIVGTPHVHKMDMITQGVDLARSWRLVDAESAFLAIDNLDAASSGIVYHNLGYLHYCMKENQKAKQLFERALQVDPSLAQSRHNLSVLIARLP